jgi:hypothetical protein
LTRWETALRQAKAYGFQGEEAKLLAKHFFAKMIVGGATIGRVNGKLVVHRKGGTGDVQKPILP